MSYLLIFDNYTIRYLDTSKFLDGKLHSVGRIDTETGIQPDVQSRINLYRKKTGIYPK